jgi:hypothetical protein
VGLPCALVPRPALPPAAPCDDPAKVGSLPAVVVASEGGKRRMPKGTRPGSSIATTRTRTPAGGRRSSVVSVFLWLGEDEDDEDDEDDGA